MIHKRIDKKSASRFSKKLLLWHADIDRKMPWVGIKDPYKIWLSEVILQQTRVEQGKPYYLNFIKAYPRVQMLAEAPLDEVLKLWQGLGYYSRARNLHFTAKQVVSLHKGKFPVKYDELIQLKGIGSYTAAAISSFAANEPHPVVDGNVIRVLSRVFGITETAQSTAGKKLFQQVAAMLLDKKNAGRYNQALMDFGALICLPKKPLCAQCVFKRTCYAALQDVVAELPTKKIKATLKLRFFNYFFITHNDSFLISYREQKDIWQGLYELPLIETHNAVTLQELLQSDEYKHLSLQEMSFDNNVFEQTQNLTHRKIHFKIYTAKTSAKTFKNLSKTYKTCKMADIKKISFPKTLAYFLNIYHLRGK